MVRTRGRRLYLRGGVGEVVEWGLPEKLRFVFRKNSCYNTVDVVGSPGDVELFRELRGRRAASSPPSQLAE